MCRALLLGHVVLTQGIAAQLQVGQQRWGHCREGTLLVLEGRRLVCATGPAGSKEIERGSWQFGWEPSRRFPSSPWPREAGVLCAVRLPDGDPSTRRYPAASPCFCPFVPSDVSPETLLIWVLRPGIAALCPALHKSCWTRVTGGLGGAQGEQVPPAPSPWWCAAVFRSCCPALVFKCLF